MRTEASVGGYTLLAKIGEGGMGVVHLARRPGGERVALKVLRPHIVGDEEARARLAREVGSLSRIRSRWVAEIVDSDPWADVPYVATRYVPGLSLHDHVVEEGPISGEDLDHLARCLVEGLGSVHGVGVLHRDVKPSNVLMEGRTPILIDFGLARVADDPRLTHTGWLLGTPGYLAPEILYGEDATAASDVHSWAATVAYAGTGRGPFGRGPSMAIMDRVRRGEHDLTGLPDHLSEVLAAALEPEPEHRPTLEDLRDWLRPHDTRVRPALSREEDDPYTVPLALGALGAAERTTDRFPAAPTVAEPVDPTLVDDQGWAYDHLRSGTPVGESDQLDRPHVPAWGTQQEWSGEPGWPEEQAWPPEPRPVPWSERLRRGLLLLGGAAAVGLGVAAYPWLTAAVVLLVVWLLRAGSSAASAVGARRLVRGRRWYDGVQLLLGAPWHVLTSLAGTVVLVLWSAGLGVAAALLCYAVAAGVETTLAVSGTVLALCLWSGPGSARVRSPLRRVVNPLSASVRGWLVGMFLVLAMGVLLALRVANAGVTWTPAQDRPFAGMHLPDHIPGSVLDGLAGR